ncbi:MAG TPA: Ig-like domain-containing protein, partial [Planctomycetota bacterium]|nr:Ig-like domain-containing protein [Planctomycetota bacterium]
GAAGTTVGTGAWTAAIALTSGSNLITITATDAAGNVSTSTITVIDDNQSPTISVTSPSSAVNLNSSTTPINLGGTASDNVQVSKVTWSNPAAAANGTAVGTTAWNASVPLVLGTNQITLTAFDEVGNASSRTVNVTYDPGAPSIGITAPTIQPTFLTGSSPLDFAGTSSDLLVVSSVTWTNATTGATGTAAGTTSWTATIPLNPGPNLISFTATDGIGTTTSASIAVTLDVTAPVVTIVTPTPPTFVTQVRPLAISGTAIDDTSVTQVAWSNGLTGASGQATFAAPNWNANIPLVPGANVITVKAVDPVGNIGSASITVNFSLETSPPTIAIDPSLLPAFTSPTQLATIFGTASDPIAVTQVSWINKTTGTTGLATGTTSWTTTVPLTGGANDIAIIASNDGGVTAIEDVTVTFVATAQTSPPSVNITQPTTAATFNATTSPLNLHCTAIDAVGVVTVAWNNQATYGTGLCSWGSDWFAGIPMIVGSNPITVTATDTSGNVATATITITYKPPVGDPVPPVVAITSPAGSGTVTVAVPQIDLAGTATDNVSVSTVTFSNAATGVGATAAGTTSWTASTIPLMTGVNVLTVRALDPSGNLGQATLVVVYTPPASAKPVAPTIPAGMCGCTGLELLLALGAAWARRRLRRRSG